MLIKIGILKPWRLKDHNVFKWKHGSRIWLVALGIEIILLDLLQQTNFQLKTNLMIS